MPELTTAGAILLGLLTVASAIRYGASAIARAGRRAVRRSPDRPRTRPPVDEVDGETTQEADEGSPRDRDPRLDD